MTYSSAPRDIWRLDRLDQRHRVLERKRFSSDWNEPYAAGTLRRPAPEDPPQVLRNWGGPPLLVLGVREMTFPIGVARRLHADVPASTLVEVPEAAHMAHFDNPSNWLAAIRGSCGPAESFCSASTPATTAGSRPRATAATR